MDFIDFSDYQVAARSTAIYPKIGNNFPYVALGLVDETLEFLEKMTNGSDDTEKLKELGDVSWYISNCYSELGLPMGKAPTYPVVYNYGNECTTLDHILINCGKVAGLAKKAIRDDDGLVTEERSQKIKTLLEFIKNDWVEIVVAMGGYPEEVLQGNLDKLQSRKDRGVLTGSGDNR